MEKTVSLLGGLHSITKAAELLDVKVPTIRSWVAQRRLASVRCGRLVKISAAELERFVRENTVPANSDH